MTKTWGYGKIALNLSVVLLCHDSPNAAPASLGWRSRVRRSPVTTFAPLTPLNRRISLALAHLRAARYDGDPQAIYITTRRLDDLLERIACRPLAAIDPELDQHLTISP